MRLVLVWYCDVSQKGVETSPAEPTEAHHGRGLLAPARPGLGRLSEPGAAPPPALHRPDESRDFGRRAKLCDADDRLAVGRRRGAVRQGPHSTLQGFQGRKCALA